MICDICKSSVDALVEYERLYLCQNCANTVRKEEHWSNKYLDYRDDLACPYCKTRIREATLKYKEDTYYGEGYAEFLVQKMKCPHCQKNFLLRIEEISLMVCGTFEEIAEEIKESTGGEENSNQ